MEQKFSNLVGVMEAANHSKNSVMEAENHVKNKATLSNGNLFLRKASITEIGSCKVNRPKRVQARCFERSRP